MKFDCKEEAIVIFEGITEKYFLSRLKELFESKYHLKLEKANGKDEIIKKYKSKRKIYSKNKIFIMYDLDCKDTIQSIKKKYKDENISLDNAELYFVNPNFELILCMTKVKTPSLKTLTRTIEKEFEIENYCKSEKQLEKIVKQISIEDAIFLMTNLEKISKNDEETKSSNYINLLKKIFKIEMN